VLKNKGIKSFRIVSPVFVKFSSTEKSIGKSERNFRNSTGFIAVFLTYQSVPRALGEEKNVLRESLRNNVFLGSSEEIKTEGPKPEEILRIDALRLQFYCGSP
jgi:hypothetical protein